jgi:hypothetical protein
MVLSLDQLRLKRDFLQYLSAISTFTVYIMEPRYSNLDSRDFLSLVDLDSVALAGCRLDPKYLVVKFGTFFDVEVSELEAAAFAYDLYVWLIIALN